LIDVTVLTAPNSGGHVVLKDRIAPGQPMIGA
jgi:hypothetical protein